MKRWSGGLFVKQEQMNQTSHASILVNGAAVLGLAALISKLLGTLQKIPMQNIGGDEVFGIYNAVFPFYTLILFLATAGFPIAVSKFVSEYIAHNNLYDARRVLRISSWIVSITGFIFCTGLFLGAGIIAHWIDNSQTKLAIQSISFALLFVPLMAAFRGYFQGLQNMMPTGVSQVLEQVIRVITMIVLLLVFTSFNASKEWIAAGATFGSVTGAMAGLLVMLIYGMKDQKTKSSASKYRERESNKVLTKKLIYYAIPVCLGAIVVPVLSIVDTFTMPRMLKLDGSSETEAMIQFGIYARGLPLVQLVALLFSSLSVVLVPAIASAKLKGEWKSIHHRTELSVRFTWLIGLAASFGLAVTVVPMNILFYTNEVGSMAIAILAFTAVFSSLNIITASILQGLGAVFVPVLSLLFAVVVKIGLNLWWIPLWGIEGAAAAAVVTFIAASLVNMLAILKHTNIKLSWTLYIIKPGVAILIMSSLLWIWIEAWYKMAERVSLTETSRWFAGGVSLSTVSIGVVVYLLLLFRLKAIRVQELNYLPKMGPKMITILTKYKIV